MFDTVFDRTIGSEGGFQADRRDRGNWTSGEVGKGELKGTKYGLSAMTYPDLDIKAITLQQARRRTLQDRVRCLLERHDRQRDVRVARDREHLTDDEPLVSFRELGNQVDETQHRREYSVSTTRARRSANISESVWRGASMAWTAASHLR